MQAKERTAPATGPAPAGGRALLLVDIDGVVSLFGFPPTARPEGSFHTIDGIPHFLSTVAARHLLDLVSVFAPVWASGWEEKAEEYLPHLLGLPRGWPFLSFERDMRAMGGAQQGTGAPGTESTRGHWKLEAIDAYAEAERPLAWIDDAFDDSCHAWAKARPGATLLVPTLPHTGLTEREAAQLKAWARSEPVLGWPGAAAKITR